MSDSTAIVSKPTGLQPAPLKPTVRKQLVILSISQVSRVGKSTVCATLLLEKIGGQIYSVEGRNEDATQHGVPVVRFQPEQILELRAAMKLYQGNCIVDIGASKYDEFIKRLTTARMFDFFDYVVVTTDPSGRAIEETISTFKTLTSMGFDMSKVRVVFNRIDPDKEVEDQFEEVFAYAHANPDLKLDPGCALPDSQVFEAMRECKLSWPAAISATVDYDAEIARLVEDGKGEEASKASLRSVTAELAVGAKWWVDKAFPALHIAMPPKKA
jgi:hypothetical protein